MAKRAISGLLIVILLCGGAFYYYTTTPGYAVARIQDALAEGDVATFEKYVDLDRLLETLLDDLMAQAIFDWFDDTKAPQSYTHKQTKKHPLIKGCAQNIVNI